MDIPEDFRCPISMELMEDPVTISTGVTYERKSIEKWFFSYKKKTCPTTMQNIEYFVLTPNHTLKRLILAWQETQTTSSSSSLPPSIKHDELVSLISTIDSSPFKVSSLKKLRSVIEISDEIKVELTNFGGHEVLVKIIVQILVESSDFTSFAACEEALGVLNQLPLWKKDDKILALLSKPECIMAMATMLQRGSAESRFYTISIFQKLAKIGYDWSFIIQDEGVGLFKALLELVSDEMCPKASSCALQVLIEILTSLKKSRLKAIETGAICTLIELLPDSNRSKCEKILYLIKLLCECADGRLALIEHGLGIGATTKKMLHVSNVATKIVVKILWLICASNPADSVLEEMLFSGAVKKFVALLHTDGRSSTKDKVANIFKLHGNIWMRYPCFPSNWKDYLGFRE